MITFVVHHFLTHNFRESIIIVVEIHVFVQDFLLKSTFSERLHYSCSWCSLFFKQNFVYLEMKLTFLFFHFVEDLFSVKT